MTTVLPVGWPQILSAQRNITEEPEGQALPLLDRTRAVEDLPGQMVQEQTVEMLRIQQPVVAVAVVEMAGEPLARPVG